MPLANSILLERCMRFRLHRSDWRGISSSVASAIVLYKESGEAEVEMYGEPDYNGVDHEEDDESKGIVSSEMMVPLFFSDLIVP